MTFAKAVFLAIDKIFDGFQNPFIMKKILDDVVCEKDISYSEEYPDQLLDLYYLPKADKEEKYPVIFEIHGGGFSAGDKKYRTVLCQYFAEKTGAFVVNVNYGLGGENVCPMPLRHLVAAVNWVYANAEKYNLDLSRAVVTGDSAGAYYSSMLCALQKCEYLQKTYECKMNFSFSGAILNCGLYDINTALKQKIPFNLADDVCMDFAGITTKGLPTFKYRNAINSIDFIDSRFPSTLVIYSEKDVFCGGQGQDFVAKLKKANVPVRSYGSKLFLDNHTFSLTWTSAAAREANKIIIEWLRDLFGKKAE